MQEIAVFVPEQEMCRRAEELAKRDGYQIRLIRQVSTEQVVQEARKAVSAQGVRIIVAGGREAALLKKETRIMVSKIRVTAQELGIAARQARSLTGRKKPRVAVFAWEGMLSDTSLCERLYGIQLRCWLFEEERDPGSVLEAALEEKPDVLIGGGLVQAFARARGIPCLAYPFTEESLKNAMDHAQELRHMALQEQHSYAQFLTVLDSSNNGILRLTDQGIITLANRSMEYLTGRSQKQLEGLSLTRVFPELDREALEQLLKGEAESYTTFVRTEEGSLVLAADPIRVEDRVEGAIVSVSRLQRMERENNRLKEQYLRGYVARFGFEEALEQFPGLEETIRRAQLYAPSSSPVLIEGSAGQESDLICQGIHNYSSRSGGPYIVINLAGTSEEQQMRLLFGTRFEMPGRADGLRTGAACQPGALEQAAQGTLVIQSIDKMTLPVQYHVARVIRSGTILYHTADDMVRVDTRILACTSKDMDTCRRLNRIRGDLYYSLNALKLRIPPLRERPEDMEHLLRTYMKRYMEQYSRYHVLAPGAKALLLSYAWPGNAIQLKAFCERMILTARRRSITQDYVRELLEELYANTREPDYYTVHGLQEPAKNSSRNEASGSGEESEKAQPETERKRAELEEALHNFGGNRKKTAQALGISTTTLWRRLRQYGIQV